MDQRKRRTSCGVALASLLAAVMVVAGCGGGGGSSDGGTPPSGASVQSNAADVADLVTVARVEMETYTDLLSIYSEDGTKPLFDPTVDYDWDDWEMLGDVANRMADAEPLFEEALASLKEKGGAARGGRSAAIIGWLSAGYSYLSGGARFQENVRNLSSKVMRGMSTTQKANIYNVMAAMKEDRSLPSSVDIGTNYSTFYEKFNNGELDDYVTRIHRRLYDNVDEGLGGDSYQVEGYGNICQDNNVNIGTTINKEGMKLLESGGALYLHGVSQVSPDLGNGIQKAIDFHDTVKSGDPLDFVKKTSKNFLKDRIKAKLAGADPDNKYRDFVAGEVSGEITDAMEETMAKGVQVFAQHTERMEIERAVAEDDNVPAGDKAKEAWARVKAADEDRESGDDGGAGGDAWGFGAVVSSVADGVSTVGNMLVSWVDAEAGCSRLMLSLEPPEDGAPMPIPAEVGDVEVVVTNAASTSGESEMQVEVVDECIPGHVDGVEVDPEDPPPTQESAALILTASDDAPGTADEVTITGEISTVLFPPFSVAVAVTGPDTAILVADSVSEDRTISAEFSSTSEGTYSYTFTVTDAFGNTASSAISLTVADAPVEPPAPTAATYRANDSFTSDPGTEDEIDWAITVTVTMDPDGTLSGTVTGTGAGMPISNGTFTGTWGAGTFEAFGSFQIGGDTIQFGYGGSFTSLDQQAVTGSIDGGDGALTTFTANRI